MLRSDYLFLPRPVPQIHTSIGDYGQETQRWFTYFKYFHVLVPVSYKFLQGDKFHPESCLGLSGECTSTGHYTFQESAFSAHAIANTYMKASLYYGYFRIKNLPIKYKINN